jgi:hypothetical protein
MSKYGHFACVNKKVRWSAEEGKFVCGLHENEIEEIKRWYLQDYVLAHWDEFSPIVHKEEYKKSYHCTISSDRCFENVRREEENGDWRLKVKFYDQHMQVQARLKVIETES